MRALVVQHVGTETPALVGDALWAAGVEVEVCRTDRGDGVPPTTAGYAALVVMGGPMSARSDDGFPSRRAELALLLAALDAGTPTLGICLGAQLLAAAAGGEVLPGDGEPQVGWGPVTFTEAAATDPLLHDLPAELPVLHWHGDTYRPPPTAVRLAGDARYRQQATVYPPRAWGLQFHVEVGAADVDRFAEAFPEDVAAAGGPEALRAATDRRLPVLGPHRDLLLARFAGLVAGRR